MILKSYPNKFIKIAVVVLLILFVSYYFFEKQYSNKSSFSSSEKKDYVIETIKETKSRRVDTRSLLPSNKPSKSYKYTKDEVYNLSQNYPESRDRLIEIATSADPYAVTDIKIKPGSLNEIRQEKFGALRIMSLKALMDFESNKTKKIKNLTEVIKKSKDPVIKKVALSMLNSLKNNRDYTKDFLKAADD